MVDLRAFALRHQFGGELAIVANGIVLDKKMSHVKLNGRRGWIRVRLPDQFFEGVTGPTDAQALGKRAIFMYL